MSLSARTFSHPPVLCPAALEMLREELKHVLQAPADDITGVSGTGPAGKQFQLQVVEVSAVKQ